MTRSLVCTAFKFAMSPVRVTSKTSKWIKTIGFILPRSKVAESGEKNQITMCLISKAYPKESVPLFFVTTLTPTTVATTLSLVSGKLSK